MKKIVYLIMLIVSVSAHAQEGRRKILKNNSRPVKIAADDSIPLYGIWKKDHTVSVPLDSDGNLGTAKADIVPGEDQTLKISLDHGYTVLEVIGEDHSLVIAKEKCVTASVKKEDVKTNELVRPKAKVDTEKLFDFNCGNDITNASNSYSTVSYSGVVKPAPNDMIPDDEKLFQFALKQCIVIPDAKSYKLDCIDPAFDFGTVVYSKVK